MKRPREVSSGGDDTRAGKMPRIGADLPVATRNQAMVATFLIDMAHSEGVRYPRSDSDFHGYFIGECDCWPHHNGQKSATSERMVLRGKVFSTKRYYVYTARLKPMTIDDNRSHYVITEILNTQRVELTKGLLVYMLKTELKINDDQRAIQLDVVNGLPNLTDDALADELRRTSLIDLFKTSDYFANMVRFRVFRVFSEHSGRVLRLTDEELDELRSRIDDDPVEIVIRGEMKLGLGRVDLRRFLEYYLPGVAMSSIQVDSFIFVDAMNRAQERSQCSVLRISNILSAYPAWKPVPSDETFRKILDELVARKKVYLPKNIEGCLMFQYTRDKEMKIIEMMQKVVDNFNSLEVPSELEKMADELNYEGLNEEQRLAYRRIVMNPISVIAGFPGVGKTEIIGRFAAQFKECVAVTFVGMQAANLRTRVDSNATTMHSYIFRHKKLLNLPEVERKPIYNKLTRTVSLARNIIIDEFPNIGLVEAADFLEAMVTKAIGGARAKKVPITRLILAGDCNQIFPIGLGQVGLDISRAFGPHASNLTTNMRVYESARMLVELDRRLLARDRRWLDELKPWTTDMLGQNFCGVPAIVFGASNCNLDSTLRYIINRHREANENYKTLVDALNNMVFLGFEKRDVSCLARGLRAIMADKYEVLLQRGRRFMVVDRLFMRKPVMKTYKDKIVYTDEARNGQVFEVKRIRLLSKRKHDEAVELEKLYRGFSQANDYIFVDTTDGKTFCINDRFLHPNYISSGDVATVNKMQGGEANIVVGYLRPGISDNVCWTNAELHVMVSRARRQLIIIADDRDLVTIMERLPPERHTRMPELFNEFVATLSFN